MAEPGTLHDAFVDELRDVYDGEKQLLKALAKLAKAATAEDLKAAFESHLEETRTHVERLEERARDRRQWAAFAFQTANVIEDCRCN